MLRSDPSYPLMISWKSSVVNSYKSLMRIGFDLSGFKELQSVVFFIIAVSGLRALISTAGLQVFTVKYNRQHLLIFYLWRPLFVKYET